MDSKDEISEERAGVVLFDKSVTRGTRATVRIWFLGYSRGANTFGSGLNFRPTYRSHTFSISDGVDIGHSKSKTTTKTLPSVPLPPLLLPRFGGN